MKLLATQAVRDQPVASREADLSDTRLFRHFNPMALPGDFDGAPTWNNLLADRRRKRIFQKGCSPIRIVLAQGYLIRQAPVLRGKQ